MAETWESLLAHDRTLALAWRAAVRAGDFLSDERPPALTVEAKSTATDAVTAMDRGAEQLIIGEIQAACPADGILGEESGERSGTTGVRWVVDPLDGTVNYIYGLPVWGVSIGVERNGTAEVGVVAAPELSMVWCAVRGRGAWEIHRGVARRIAPRPLADLGSALVATGFGYDAGRRARQGTVISQLLPEVRDIRRVGAAVVDLCWVASGRYDAFFERGLNPWDYVAGALIAQEAGAVVRGIGGSTFSEGLMAATPGIADRLHARLVELQAHRA